jgi:TolB protein
MSLRLLVSITALACVAPALAADRHIAFERDQAIWMANLDGTGEKKIADGIFPAISPDGTRVAFTQVEKSGTTYVRHIAVVDLATGKTNVFKDVPSENAYYPTWSPDGTRILFTLRDQAVWDVALINADGTGFRVIKKGDKNKVTLYSPCWGHDGQSIFCEDMTNIYRLSLNGSVLDQWNIEKIIPNGNMDGDGRIDASSDGKTLLLSIAMGEETSRKDWDGPLPALWMFDTASQKAVRVTSKSIFGWDGCWMDDQNVLYLSQASGEKTASIYRMSTKGTNVKRLLTNARFPSVNP